MTTVKTTYVCSAGFHRTFDMKKEEIFDTIEPFVGFDSKHPHMVFTDECENCEIAQRNVTFDFDDDTPARLIKTCSLTRVIP